MVRFFLVILYNCKKYLSPPFTHLHLHTHHMFSCIALSMTSTVYQLLNKLAVVCTMWRQLSIDNVLSYLLVWTHNSAVQLAYRFKKQCNIVKERHIYFYSKDIYSRVTVHCMLVVAMVTLYIYTVINLLEIMLL